MATEKKTDETLPSFTQGPWAAFKGLLDDEGIWIMSTHVEDAVVASIGMDLPEAETNARLIAAAPALYDAALVTLGILRDGDPRDAVIFLEQALALAGWKG